MLFAKVGIERGKRGTRLSESGAYVACQQQVPRLRVAIGRANRNAALGMTDLFVRVLSDTDLLPLLSEVAALRLAEAGARKLVRLSRCPRRPDAQELVDCGRGCGLHLRHGFDGRGGGRGAGLLGSVF